MTWLHILVFVAGCITAGCGGTLLALWLTRPRPARHKRPAPHVCHCQQQRTRRPRLSLLADTTEIRPRGGRRA